MINQIKTKIERHLNGIITPNEINLNNFGWELAPRMPYPKSRWRFYTVENRSCKGRPIRPYYEKPYKSYKYRRNAIKRGQYNKKSYYGLKIYG